MRISPPPLLRLVLPLMLGLSACSGKEVYPVDTLPEASQLGLNTAGCRVDGQIWTAAIDALFGPPAILVHYDKKGLAAGLHPLLIALNNPRTFNPAGNVQTALDLCLPNVVRPGSFVLTAAAPRSPELPNAIFYFYAAPVRTLYTGPQALGQLTITRLDTMARIVSGTFEFTAREVSGASIVRITDGRFDCTF